MDDKNLWVYKYTPSTLEEMVLHESLYDVFTTYLKKGNLPNMLLAGKPGIGKTVLAKLLAKSLPNNPLILYIHASSESGIDVVRTKITNFVNAEPRLNSLKVCILDEADGLSNVGDSGGAQGALRNIMECDLEDTRFILTCNNKHRLLDAIQSRNPVLDIRFSLKGAVKRIFEILKAEKIEYTNADKAKIVAIVQKNFPDIRLTIGVIQNCCITGKFLETNVTSDSDINNVVTYIMEHLNMPRKCREYWIKNEATFGADYMSLGSALFNKFSDPEELLLLGEQLYQLNLVLDKEIGFYMMMLAINDKRKK